MPSAAQLDVGNHLATPLMTTIVVGIGLAFVFGALAHRLRASPIVGYLIAGVVAGPFTHGYAADPGIASELAEIGVILLMFGVGLHFSLADLLSVRAIAIPGAIMQMAVATTMGAALAHAWGWPLQSGVVFGLALSAASTVVLTRSLQERRLMDSDRGRIALGWLIVEDLAMVLVLVMLPALAMVNGPSPSAAGAHAQVNAHANAAMMATTLDLPFGSSVTIGVFGVLLLVGAKVALFIVLMLRFGKRSLPWLLHEMAHTGSRELFRLAVLAVALVVAFGASRLFGVSLALGAFFAGMVLSESKLCQRAAEETLPLRDAFAVLFFVSVGMLFDPTILVREPLPVLAVLAVILIGNPLAAFVFVALRRKPLITALTIAASLAQIGEFSFILAGLGVQLDLLSAEGRDLILAGAIFSISLNPLYFAAVDRMKAAGWIEAAPETEPLVATPPPPSSAAAASTLEGHTILVGYGRVGSAVGESLKDEGAHFLVIEDADKTVARLRRLGMDVVAGNAARSEILAAANLPGAKQVIIAIPNCFEAGQVVEQARAAGVGKKRNGHGAMTIVARAHSDAEAEYLMKLGASVAIVGEREIARALVEGLDKIKAA
jgi:monovalent cation:H+ antiporter-2, CPA2 family